MGTERGSAEVAVIREHHDKGCDGVDSGPTDDDFYEALDSLTSRLSEAERENEGLDRNLDAWTHRANRQALRAQEAEAKLSRLEEALERARSATDEFAALDYDSAVHHLDAFVTRLRTALDSETPDYHTHDPHCGRPWREHEVLAGGTPKCPTDPETKERCPNCEHADHNGRLCGDAMACGCWTDAPTDSETKERKRSSSRDSVGNLGMSGHIKVIPPTDSETKGETEG